MPPPPTVEVLVETPQGSRSKYEYDHDRGAMRLDRRLWSATVFPADYGFIPDTRGADGEELDAIVLTDSPTFPGCWVTARVVALFWIVYGDEREAKVVCVPDGDPTWDGVSDVDDIPAHLKDEIAHFFDIYKELEPGRAPAPGGWANRAQALDEIARATGGADSR